VCNASIPRDLETILLKLEQRPRNEDFWTTLGVAHYRAGEWNAAIEALEKSMELRPRADPSCGFFLAMACWQKGDTEQARSWYGKAVQWMEKDNPEDAEERRFRAEAAALLGSPITRCQPARRRKSPNNTHGRNRGARSRAAYLKS